MKTKWCFLLLSVLVTLCSAWGVSAVSPCVFARAETPSEAPPLAAEVRGERVAVRLCIEGVEYAENACIPTHIRLLAASYGGYARCFEALHQGGADALDILDWAAYPLGRGLGVLLARLETPPVDACIVMGEYAPRVVPHKDGRMIDRAALLAAVGASLDGGAPRALRLRVAPAKVTTDVARRQTALVATFSTPYAEVSNRVHNLRLACRALNGVVLSAGAEFSFNATVGERTQERGYLPAKVIADGEYTEGVGGGVCQVSSTLYNAAMVAGLVQLEARRHSRAVHYVAPSRDAMVSGWSDMRFRNPYPYPVCIFAHAQEGRVTVRIYGEKPAEPISLAAQKQVTRPYRNVDEAGNVLVSTDGYVLLSAGQDGVESALVRRVGDRTEVLRRDVYPAVDAVWQRATHGLSKGDEG